MLKKIFFIFIPLFLLTLIDAFAGEYQFSATPDWVRSIKVPKIEAEARKSAINGEYYLLMDHQIRNDENGQESFHHYAREVINEQGIKQVSQISVDFTSSYETVVIHEVQIVRNGIISSQLKPGNIGILQREEDPDSQIDDGDKTIYMILDDIRVGDIVEYSYTIKGLHPVYQGKLYVNFYNEWEVPVHKLHNRILIPKERKLQFKSHGRTKIEPTIRNQGKYREYLIESERIPTVFPDDNLPSSYSPHSWIEFSEYKNWSEVVDSEIQFYAVPETLSPELTKTIDAIGNSGKSMDAQILEAIHFVQDQIRYFATQVEGSAFKPADPSLVFQRRFGDCKDKTLLLRTILAGLGVSSYPAFVNVEKGRVLKEYLPSSSAFDHVILQIFHRGKQYWIDPTFSYQRGRLNTIDEPDYGEALVLYEGNNSLTTMNTTVWGKTKTEIYELFELNEKYTDPVSWTIRTIYHGSLADSYRHQFATESIEKIEKEYLDYYASDYPEIKIREPLSYFDDTNSNLFTVVEKYRIASFWVKNKHKVTANFWAYQFYDYIERPSTELRTMPLAIEWPIHIVQTTEVQLPNKWLLNQKVKTVENDAIYFKWEQEYEKKTLKLHFELYTKKDHVTPEETKNYLRDLSRINRELNTELSATVSTSVENQNMEAANPPQEIGFTVFFILSFIVMLCFSVTILLGLIEKPNGITRLTMERYPAIPKRTMVFAMILGLLLVYFLNTAINSFPLYYEGAWRELTTVGSKTNELYWKPFLRTQLFLISTGFPFFITLLLLIFGRRRIFPKAAVGMILFYWPLSGLYLLFDVLLNNTVLVFIKHFLLFGLVSILSIVYILYFLFSKKVKNRFICTPVKWKERKALRGKIFKNSSKKAG